MNRSAHRERRTAETDISLSLTLDGSGRAEVQTGIGFFDHMLTLTAMHAGLDLYVTAQGDLDIDPHHTVEDIGIVFGHALAEALGDKAGIRRYGAAYVPMDEALTRTVIDLSGRSFCYFAVPVPADRLGTFDTELVEDFFRAFASHGQLTLHIDLIRGRNSHHIVEAVFKSFGRALSEACSASGRSGIASTKGTLSE